MDISFFNILILLLLNNFICTTNPYLFLYFAVNLSNVNSSRHAIMGCNFSFFFVVYNFILIIDDEEHILLGKIQMNHLPHFYIRSLALIYMLFFFSFTLQSDHLTKKLFIYFIIYRNMWEFFSFPFFSSIMVTNIFYYSTRLISISIENLVIYRKNVYM